MTRPVDMPEIAADDLLTAILSVMTPSQALMLVDKISQVKEKGYGRVTIVVHCGNLSQIQTQESYNFKVEENELE
jgi:hypothetical protein